MTKRSVWVVLVTCAFTVTMGFLLKARCMGAIEGLEGYRDLCINDPQEIYGARALQGGFPFRDLEYPVLTGVFMWLTSLFVDSPNGFFIATAVALTPFALISAYLLAKVAGPRALMFAAAPALVMYAFHSWDLLVVAAIVGGLLLAKDRPLWAAALFAVGAAVKFAPLIFLAPLMLAHRRQAVKIGAVGVGTFVALNLPYALIDFDRWVFAFRMHSERVANLDSVWNFLWSGSVAGLNLLTLILFSVGTLAVLWFGRDKSFVQVAAAVLCVFLLVNKVHSPQYTLWLLPFFVLLRVHWLWWFAYSVADVMVFVGIYRYFYVGSPVEELMFTTGVWARAALLLGLIVVFVRSASPSPLEEPLLSGRPFDSVGGPNPRYRFGTP